MPEGHTFTRVVRERAAVWRRTAFLMCGDWGLAEDIVQLALVRLAKHWHRIDLDGVDAYARKTIARLAIDQARRAHHHEEPWASLPDGQVADPDSDEVLDIREALRRVSPRQRVVLVLRFYDDLTVAQVAATLHISEGTVKSQTARGLDALRSHLGDPSYSSGRHR